MRSRLLGIAVLFSVAFAAGHATAADQALIDAAKKEGQVVWYTTLIVNQIIRPLKDAFEKKYPGVTLQYSRADDLVTSAKLIAEGQAGRVQADIFDGLANMAPLEEAGLLTKFTVPNADAYPAQLRSKDGYWITMNMYVFTPGINTSLLPKDQAPKTFQDLLDPKLKGKMAWNGSSMAGAYGFVANILTTMGDDKGMAYLRALAKQELVPLPIAIRAVLDRVIAGEYAIGLEMNNTHAAISAAQGAPVKWVPLNPVSETVQVAGLVKGAPHPNAAKLFLDFMISRPGQEIFRDNDYLPMHPDVQAKIPELKPEQGGYKAVLYTPDTLETEVPRWRKIGEELFR